MPTMRDEILSALKSVRFGDTENTFQAVYCFDPSLSVFEGHFPGQPVLPGVFQIEMIRIALETVSKERYGIVKVKKAKFSGITLPAQEILMTATITAEGEHAFVKARLQVEQTVKANISVALKINNRK